MTTRQDMFEQNMRDFLLEQESRKLINKEDYLDFYYQLQDWKKISEQEHPREESTLDCIHK